MHTPIITDIEDEEERSLAQALLDSEWLFISDSSTFTSSGHRLLKVVKDAGWIPANQEIVAQHELSRERVAHAFTKERVEELHERVRILEAELASWRAKTPPIAPPGYAQHISVSPAGTYYTVNGSSIL